MDQLETGRGIDWTILGLWRRAWEGLRHGWKAVVAIALLYVLVGLIDMTFVWMVSGPMTEFMAGHIKRFIGMDIPFLAEILGQIMVEILVYPITSIPLGFATVGAIKVSLDIVRGEPFSWGRLLRPELTEWAYTVGALVMIPLLSFLSFLFFVIPLFFFVLAVPMTLYVIVDQQADTISALFESFRLMRGEKTFFACLLLSITAVLTVGVSACFVGLIPALMGGMLVKVVFYEGIVARKGKMALDI